MDLSVSPDLPAYACYGLVVFLGAFTAYVQISKRLAGMEGAWFLPRTWLLFALYIFVPVGLFWLLDRTGATTDTSFFAAIFIAIGYERIIAGGNQTIRAPGELSQVWTPFLAYADSVAQVVIRQSTTRQARLTEKLVSEI